MIDLNVGLEENGEGVSMCHDSDNSSDEFDLNLDVGDGDRVGDELVNRVLEDVEPGNIEKIVPPYVGKVFCSADEIINDCHEYARESGFQIRIRSSDRKKESENTTKENGIERNRNIIDYSDCVRLRLVCSKEGKFISKSNNPRRPATTAVTGCQFKVNASLCQDGLWKLTKVILDHNHPCEPKNVKFMGNYKHISEDDKKRILKNDTAGIPIAKNFNSFVVKYGGHDNIPFDERDCRNLISKTRRLSLEEGYFVAMRRHFCEMISSNSNFFYMYDTDEKSSLTNVFWADGRSRAACKDFGDVITFDTTYVSNRYRMPFAPFIGVNNHGQSILLGCALLSGEEASTFVWLFKAWMTCMFDKAPKAILTDQCQSIGKAIAEVFLDAQNRWCIWHIMKNAKNNLNKHSKYEDVMKELKNTLHDSLTIAEFENAWHEWIHTFSLEEYKWCQEMYDKRERWVPVYFKNEFWAGMSSTQRSEGMNFFFKGFVNINTTLK
ncbi:protein FAR1-RELATED SEQUENCE 5-like [Beta vulgaris subsp. vulgaris]|uniref:protein FAR1-RELATED SEQUENCE 5-like n=1 Tax=Beta vulgaris subsp. vulgaris TaxID=3555 RepID=UPI002036747B|nr:protein FAR1-RELATED SEQUENCE 5-like [Beta vulgaris subsp. vulgaris]